MSEAEVTQHGRGKYDDECEAVFRQLGYPDGVILIVAGGAKGGGFSTCMRADRGLVDQIPAVLRRLADGIEDAYRREGRIAHVMEKTGKG